MTTKVRMIQLHGIPHETNLDIANTKFYGDYDTEAINANYHNKLRW